MKREERRQQVLACAAEAFAEKGYHGSSTKDIANHIGIKQGSLYYYFASKEEAEINDKRVYSSSSSFKNI